jgi:hypothetical protein
VAVLTPSFGCTHNLVATLLFIIIGGRGVRSGVSSITNEPAALSNFERPTGRWS